MKELLTGYEVVIAGTGGGEIAQALHANGDWTDIVPIKGIDIRLKGLPGMPAQGSYGQTYSNSLLDDTYARDLTINSSALIRTVRFAARYGFDIDNAITQAIANHMHYCDELQPSLLNYYVTKGFGDGCGKRTFQYYLQYGIIDRYATMLKDYAHNASYTDRIYAALDYIDAHNGGKMGLGIATIFLPCVEDALGSSQPTKENITATWDALEVNSGQKLHFELDDYSGTKTEVMTIWTLYKQMTSTATLADDQLTAAIRADKYYPKACLLLGGYAQTDSTLKPFAEYWK